MMTSEELALAIAERLHGECDSCALLQDENGERTGRCDRWQHAVDGGWEAVRVVVASGWRRPPMKLKMADEELPGQSTVYDFLTDETYEATGHE